MKKELPHGDLLSELRDAVERYVGLRRSIIDMDHLSKAGLPGRSKQRADVYKKAITGIKKAGGERQSDLASRFDVTDPTISRWLSGKREAPGSFWGYIRELELERLARADVRLQSLWLALCGDNLNDPKIVDFRLVQLWEWVVDDDLTLEKIMDLAGPLTPQAMARIEEALNTPFGEFPAKV